MRTTWRQLPAGEQSDRHPLPIQRRLDRHVSQTEGLPLTAVDVIGVHPL